MTCKIPLLHEYSIEILEPYLDFSEEVCTDWQYMRFIGEYNEASGSEYFVTRSNKLLFFNMTFIKQIKSTCKVNYTYKFEPFHTITKKSLVIKPTLRETNSQIRLPYYGFEMIHGMGFKITEIGTALK